MKKLIIAAVLSLSVVMTACGSGSSSGTSNEHPIENVEQESQEINEDQPEDGQTVQNEVEATNKETETGSVEQNTPTFFDNWIVRRTDSFKSSFSNGYKWIIIDDPRGYQYYGAVDKSGKLKFYLNKVSQMGYFSDSGKSFFESYDDKFYSVTVDGIVSPEFENAKGSIQILADYSCFCEKLEGFDTNQLKYYIYNPEGKLIREITYESDNFPDAVYYHGNGIFEFVHDFINPRPNSEVLGDFYCAKADYFFDRNLVAVMEPYQNGYFTESDYLLYYLGYSTKGELIITITDDKGNWKDITIPSEFGDNIIYRDSSDYGILFYNNDENYYFLYDIKKDTFRKFEGKYSDRIVGSGNGLGNESLAFVLEGDDHKSYLAIYDLESFELICEPILAENERYNGHPLYLQSKDSNNYKPIKDYYFALGGDHLYYGTGTIYTKNGDAVKTISNSAEIKYSEGVYQCLYENGEEDEAITFYDDDWNLLFTSKDIDYSIAEEIVY